jgi:nucleoid-associated protein YgaU
MSNESKPGVHMGVASSAIRPADFGSVQADVESSAVQIYTVVTGDNLSKIAQHFYGKASDWQQIYKANRDTVKDPDKLSVGQTLKIPPAVGDDA